MSKGVQLYAQVLRTPLRTTLNPSSYRHFCCTTHSLALSTTVLNRVLGSNRLSSCVGHSMDTANLGSTTRTVMAASNCIEKRGKMGSQTNSYNLGLLAPFLTEREDTRSTPSAAWSLTLMPRLSDVML